MRLVFPPNYGEDSILVEIDVALLPMVGGIIGQLEERYMWASDVDWELGYNAIAELQRELMGRGIQKLQMEIRAARGVDDLIAGYDDPDADPFTLSLGTIENVKRELETVNTKLEAIRLLVEAMQTAEDVAAIRTSAAQIAALLAL